MNIKIQNALNFVIGSMWFRKASMFISGMATYALISLYFWKQILALREYLGIDKGEFAEILLFLIAAGLGCISVGLSVANKKRQNKKKCQCPADSPAKVK